MSVAVLVGCSDDGTDDGTEGLPDPPASPAETGPTATVPSEHREILDVYHNAVRAAVAAQRAGDPNHPDLRRYFLERTSALLNVQSGIRRNQDRGMYYEGDLVVVTAEVTALDRDATPPRATVVSCLDDTNYRLVHRDDGSPVEGTQPGGRYTVTSEAVNGTDGRWYIATESAEWDRSC
jgi:hypothetical protein